jgi:hypothetical protein
VPGDFLGKTDRASRRLQYPIQFPGIPPKDHRFEIGIWIISEIQGNGITLLSDIMVNKLFDGNGRTTAAVDNPLHLVLQGDGYSVTGGILNREIIPQLLTTR